MTPSGGVAVILAAGLGTRMRSGRAKVLHPIAGLPLITWAVRCVRPLVDRVVVVVGHERHAVMQALEGEGVAFAVQAEQHGTGHALLCAAPELAGAARLIVMCGDMPGLATATLAALLDEHEARAASATVLTFRAQDPTGYGRVVRSPSGDVQSIVEHSQASLEVRRIDEVNSGTYVFESADTLPLLSRLPRHGQEVYLTDALEMLRSEGKVVAAHEAPEEQCAGINTQAQLAQAEQRWRASRRADLMESGVTLVDPATLQIDADVSIGVGSVIAGLVSLEGRTRIGARCDIGSLVRLRDVQVGDGSILRGPYTQEGGDIPAGARVGP